MDNADTIVDSGLLVDCVALESSAPPNQPPTCATDFTDAEANFLSPSTGVFVVTEGETITVDVTGSDADGDQLTASVSGLPGVTISPSVPVLSHCRRPYPGRPALRTKPARPIPRLSRSRIHQVQPVRAVSRLRM